MGGKLVKFILAEVTASQFAFYWSEQNLPAVSSRVTSDCRQLGVVLMWLILPSIYPVTELTSSVSVEEKTETSLAAVQFVAFILLCVFCTATFLW